MIYTYIMEINDFGDGSADEYPGSPESGAYDALGGTSSDLSAGDEQVADGADPQIDTGPSVDATTYTEASTVDSRPVPGPDQDEISYTLPMAPAATRPDIEATGPTPPPAAKAPAGELGEPSRTKEVTQPVSAVEQDNGRSSDARKDDPPAPARGNQSPAPALTDSKRPIPVVRAEDPADPTPPPGPPPVEQDVRPEPSPDLAHEEPASDTPPTGSQEVVSDPQQVEQTPEPTKPPPIKLRNDRGALVGIAQREQQGNITYAPYALFRGQLSRVVGTRTVSGTDPLTGTSYEAVTFNRQRQLLRAVGTRLDPPLSGDITGPEEGAELGHDLGSITSSELSYTYNPDGYVTSRHQVTEHDTRHWEQRTTVALGETNEARGIIIEEANSYYPFDREVPLDIRQVEVFCDADDPKVLHRIIFLSHGDMLVPRWVDVLRIDGMPIDGQKEVRYDTGLNDPGMRRYIHMGRPDGQIGLYPTHKDTTNQLPKAFFLPSMIPKSAAYELASQTKSPDELGVAAFYPELDGTVVLRPLEAAQAIEAMSDPREITRFLVALGNRQTVVLNQHTDLSSRKAVRNLAWEWSYDYLADMKRVAIVAATHPVLFRANTTPSLEEERLDKIYKSTILTELGLSSYRFTEALRLMHGDILRDGGSEAVRSWNKLVYIANLP
jgi:hypothetical protein